MKVTINKPEDSIDLSMVTEHMYFVGIHEENHLHLLSRQETNFGKFRFMSIDGITRGCRYYIDGDTLKEAITSYALHGEVHAFHTYAEAVEFISENL